MLDSKFRPCLESMLRPIARFCVRRSVTLQDLISLFKSLLFSEALAELAKGNEKPSISRVSAMTGIHRKDLQEFMKRPPAAMEVDAKRHVISRVISTWQNASPFSTKSGTPKLLSVDSENGGFFDLVRSVSSDLNPYTVLKELERAEIVERTADGVKLRSSAYLINRDVKSGFKMLGSDLGDMLSAVEENLLSPRTPRNLHLKTEYDNIPKEFEPKIREWILKEGSEFQKRVSAFLRKHDRDENKLLKGNGESVRVIVGTFGFTEQGEA